MTKAATKIFLITLFFLITSFSKYSFAQNGVVKSYYPNGSVQSEISYVNDVLDGNAIWYYENGKVMSEKNYSNGVLDGLVKNYFENGNIKEEYMISLGVRDGIYKSYFDSGVLKEVATYNKGKVVSFQKFEASPSDIIKDENKISLQNKIIKEEAVKEEVPKVEIPKQDISKADVQNIERAQEPLQNKELSKLNAMDSVTQKTIDKAAPQNTLPEHLTIICEAEICPKPEDDLRTIYSRMEIPNVATALNLKGAIVIEGVVSKNGLLSNTKIIEGIGYGCDQQVESALLHTKFSPAVKKGEIVDSKIIIHFPFSSNF